MTRERTLAEYRAAMADDPNASFYTLNHPYSPSTVPSVDGQGCLHRERLADGTYSLRTCRFMARVHPTTQEINR